MRYIMCGVTRKLIQTSCTWFSVTTSPGLSWYPYLTPHPPFHTSRAVSGGEKRRHIKMQLRCSPYEFSTRSISSITLVKIPSVIWGTEEKVSNYTGKRDVQEGVTAALSDKENPSVLLPHPTISLASKSPISNIAKIGTACPFPNVRTGSTSQVLCNWKRCQCNPRIPIKFNPWQIHREDDGFVNLQVSFCVCPFRHPLSIKAMHDVRPGFLLQRIPRRQHPKILQASCPHQSSPDA